MNETTIKPELMISQVKAELLVSQVKAELLVSQVKAELLISHGKDVQLTFIRHGNVIIDTRMENS